MKIRRAWWLLGAAVVAAGFVHGVKSGRLGGWVGGGAEPAPVLMTPANPSRSARPGGGTESSPSIPRPPVPTEVVAGSGNPGARAAPRDAPPQVQTSTAQAAVQPAKRDSAPRREAVLREPPVLRADALPAAPAPGRSVVPTQIKDRSDSVETLIRGLIVQGELKQARDHMRDLPGNGVGTLLGRSLDAIEKSLADLAAARQSSDPYEVQRILERWDRPGQLLPSPEPAAVVSAREWAEGQRRAGVEQKEWRVKLTNAIASGNADLMGSLLARKDYPDDPVREAARNRLVGLRESDDWIREVRKLIQDSNLEEAQDRLSKARNPQDPAVVHLRAELGVARREWTSKVANTVADLRTKAGRLDAAAFEDDVSRLQETLRSAPEVKAVIRAAREAVRVKVEVQATPSGGDASAAQVAPTNTVKAAPLASAAGSTSTASAPVKQADRVVTDEEILQGHRKTIDKAKTGRIPPNSIMSIRSNLELIRQRSPGLSSQVDELLVKLKNYQ